MSRVRVAAVALVVLTLPLLPAHAASPHVVENALLIPMGQPPPASASVLAECHGVAPADLFCETSFSPRTFTLRASSCDETIATCDTFTGKLRMTLLDNKTYNEVHECYFDAGLRQGCRQIRGDHVMWGPTFVLRVEVMTHTIFGNELPDNPKGGWHVWAATG